MAGMTTKRCRAVTTHAYRELDFETLEARRMLAANIDGDGNLTIDGTEGFDIISVIQFGPDTTAVIGNVGIGQGNGTVVASVPLLDVEVVLFGAVNDLTINTHGGQDIVTVGYSVFSGIVPVSIGGQLNIDLGEGFGNAAIVVNTTAGGGVQVLGGGGNDQVLIAYSTINGDMLVQTGAGDDAIQLGVGGAPVLGAKNVVVDTGDGNDALSFGNVPIPGYPGTFEVDSLTARMGAGDDQVNVAGPIVANGTVSLDGEDGFADLLEIAVPISAVQTEIIGFEGP